MYCVYYECMYCAYVQYVCIINILCMYVCIYVCMYPVKMANGSLYVCTVYKHRLSQLLFHVIPGLGRRARQSSHVEVAARCAIRSKARLFVLP